MVTLTHDIVAQEMTLKEAVIQKLETSAENYRRKFSIIRHQISLLYKEYETDKKVCI